MDENIKKMAGGDSVLKKQLEEMGLKKTDTVLIHSSLKAINRDVNEVLDDLMSYFDEGLLLMPTHTWKQMNETYNFFDPEKEESCVGLLTERFRKRPGVVRSLHPTHSMAGYGNKAKAYLAGDEYAITPVSPNGSWGRLSQVDATIMLIGCDMIRNTFVHAVEEMMGVPNRFTPRPITFKVKKDNSVIIQKAHKHFNADNPHLSENYKKAEDKLIELGIIKKGKFGDADVLYMKALELQEKIMEWLELDIDLFSDTKPMDEHINI